MKRNVEKGPGGYGVQYIYSGGLREGAIGRISLIEIWPLDLTFPTDILSILCQQLRIIRGIGVIVTLVNHNISVEFG
jgi:hypothetical protein